MSTLQELAAVPVPPGACQVWINRVLCGEPAESTWEGGCGCKHVAADIEICAAHRELAGDPFTCVACEPDHECTVQLREVAR